MKLETYYPLWGSESESLEDFCRRVEEAGYDGVEAYVPEEGFDTDRFLETLDRFGLKLIAQHALTLETDFELHKRVQTRRLRHLANLRPRFINSQTGRDLFTFDQNRELLDLAQECSAATGVPILHETHRGRFSFAAHVAAKYLESVPELRLTLDISHWCVVAESLLADQEEAVALAISRTDHVHARIGFAQGPQIVDPSSGVWKREVNTHLEWWHRVGERLQSENRSSMTVTTEFGPVPYSPVEPAHGTPLLSQWEANLSMKRLFAAHLGDILDSKAPSATDASR